MKKPIFKKWWFWLIIVIIVVAAVNGGSDNKTSKAQKTVNTKTESKALLTESDKKLLKKHYKDFDANERTQFDEIEEKYKKITNSEKKSIESDFERLSKERDVQVEEWKKEDEKKEKAKQEEEKKKWDEFVKKNTKKLPAGEHIVGKHIQPGDYIVTFNGSGNFVIYDKNGSLLTNEVGGSDLGITQYKAILLEGSKIQIKSMSANFKPIKRNLVPYKETNIYSGYWVVGQDLSSGRYKAVATSGSGNFMVFSSDGGSKTNEILGGDIGVKEVIINLEDGDIIDTKGIRNVKLSPIE